ncbi:MAG: DUF2157 domain-containing protein [Clostridia bacterium]
MDKRTLIMQEADKWVSDGIITAEQRDRISERYPVQAKVSVLPILAAILFGLGVLAFIASNWGGISPVGKLLIIFVSLVLAYIGGEKLRGRDYVRLGTALTLIGLAIFGAGFFLIGQMYHLSANPVNAFYLWFIGTLPFVWHYKERALFVALQLILTVSAIYGEIFAQREGLTVLTYYVLYAAGVLPLLWRFRGTGLVTFSLASFLMFALIDVSRWGEGLIYPFILLVSFTLSQLLPKNSEPFGHVLRVLSYFGIFFFSTISIFGDNFLYLTPGRVDTVIVIGMAVLIGFLVVRSIRNHSLATVGDLFPYAVFAGIYAAIALLTDGAAYGASSFDFSVPMILGLFVFSSVMIMSGEKLRQVYRINLGAFFFGASCFIAYINFAWDFMDKSIFLLLGGALLLAISYVLERKRRRWVNEARRDDL